MLNGDLTRGEIEAAVEADELDPGYAEFLLEKIDGEDDGPWYVVCTGGPESPEVWDEADTEDEGWDYLAGWTGTNLGDAVVELLPREKVPAEALKDWEEK